MTGRRTTSAAGAPGVGAEPDCTSHLDPSGEELQLLPLQRQQWFLARLRPEDPSYHIQTALEIEGRLSLERLDRSLRQLVTRNEALRVCFVDSSGQPLQIIAHETACALHREPSLANADEAGRALGEAARRPFDLMQPPLFRVHVWRLGPQRHLCLLVMHHIIGDLASLGLFISGLFDLYEADLKAAPPVLAPAARRFSSVVREIIEKQASPSPEGKAFWSHRLSGAAPLLPLPCDHARPARWSGAGRTSRYSIPLELAEHVRWFGRENATTPFIILLAAFKLMLARYARTSDILVGTPVSQRRDYNLQRVIGPLVETCVIRTRVDDDLTFRAFVYRLKVAVAEFLDHSATPFDTIVSDLGASGTLDHHPVFQVMFGFSELPAAPSVKRLRTKLVDVPTSTARFDLMFALHDCEGAMGLDVEYCADLFELTTINTMARHFLNLLRAALAAPTDPLRTLPILTDSERQQAVAHSRGPVLTMPHFTVTDLFQAQVRRTPHRCALTSTDGEISYEVLANRADCLARRLRSLGAGPEVIVGTCLDRSADAVVAVLAILQTGAAFLPIEPDAPPARARMLLEDSGAAICLKQGENESVVAHALKAAVVGVWRPAAGRDAAYVIYTSGSTGRPKGVIVNHEALTNRLEWMRHYLALQADDVVLHKTPQTFDVSVWEMLLPLIAGCRVVVAPDGTQRDGEALARTIEAEGVTIAHFVPSALRGFLDCRPAPNCLRSLRNVICSGETFDSVLLAETQSVTAARIHNLYGPTEAAIDVTAYECPQDWDPACAVPIGRPIANTEVFILDEELQPCPDGVVGEVWIGGVQVARGYLNRPRMTAVRFVPSPFSNQPGARLYRTGDLGRRLRTGAIEFLGREDSQVKIRGCRIELGEVEAAILHLPSVRRAAAVAHRADSGGQQLAAYYVLRKGHKLTEQAMRTQLARLLPRHMVPDMLVRLDEMPILVNGKLDRSRLPMPLRRHSLPRNIGESLMARLWGELFHRDDIHADDDFFQLGGDSMLAIRLVAKARAAGIALGAEDIFRARTVRAMASLSRRPAKAMSSTHSAFSLLSESSRASIGSPTKET